MNIKIRLLILKKPQDFNKYFNKEKKKKKLRKKNIPHASQMKTNLIIRVKFKVTVVLL
jgi:hypothetical protein